MVPLEIAGLQLHQKFVEWFRNQSCTYLEVENKATVVIWLLQVRVFNILLEEVHYALPSERNTIFAGHIIFIETEWLF